MSDFSLHANVAIRGGNRLRLEGLCKYAGLPVLAANRLEALLDGRLLYALKPPSRNGTTHVIF